MSAKALAIALVGAGCVTAAGAGGFYALRQNQPDAALTATSTAATTPVESVSATPGATSAAAPAAAPGTVTSKPAPAPTRAARSTSAPPRRGAPAPREASPPAAEPTTDRTTDRTEVPLNPPPAVSTGLGTIPAPVATPVEAPTPVLDPEPVRPTFVELTVDEDSVIGVRLDTNVSSETAKIEDRVTAIVTRDVVVDGRTAIPARSRLEGNVSLVERGGRFKERARLELRFTTLVLGDNTRIPISTLPIFREGESPKGEAASKIGASAVVGAILGSVIGGKKGAAIGGTAGAAGGTAVVAAGDPNAAALTAGTALTVKVTKPIVVLVERDPYIR